MTCDKCGEKFTSCATYSQHKSYKDSGCISLAIVPTLERAKDGTRWKWASEYDPEVTSAWDATLWQFTAAELNHFAAWENELVSA
jgi:hypothetical protein